MASLLFKTFSLAVLLIGMSTPAATANNFCRRFYESQTNTSADSKVKIRLTTPARQLEPDGSTTYRTNEGHFSVIKYVGQDRTTISTFGLASCVGISFYDKVSKVGLVSHFVTIRYGSDIEIQRYIRHLLDAFTLEGGNASNIEVNLIMGSFSAKYSEQLNSLVSALNISEVQKVNISFSESPQPRGFSLNLEDGKVYDLIPGGSISWTWSKEHSLQLNQRNLYLPR